MKIPYLKKLIETEFDQYLKELYSHALSCTSAGSGRDGAKRIYGLMFPLFKILRRLDEVDFEHDPSRSLMLDQMRVHGDKNGFVKVLRSASFRGELNGVFVEALKEMRSTPYLNELWSDALLCVNSFTLFNYRGANIALRCMMEDLYRHVYYKDHAEEYGALRFDPSAEEDFKLSPAELRDYIKKVGSFRVFSELNSSFQIKKDKTDEDLFDLNDNLYSVLSGYVHGSKIGSMNSFRSNSNAQRDARRENFMLEVVKKFIKLSCSLLIAAHSNEFRSFSEYDKSIVFSAFSISESHDFRRAINV